MYSDDGYTHYLERDETMSIFDEYAAIQGQDGSAQVRAVDKFKSDVRRDLMRAFKACHAVGLFPEMGAAGPGDLDPVKMSQDKPSPFALEFRTIGFVGFAIDDQKAEELIKKIVAVAQSQGIPVVHSNRTGQTLTVEPGYLEQNPERAAEVLFMALSAYAKDNCKDALATQLVNNAEEIDRKISALTNPDVGKG